VTVKINMFPHQNHRVAQDITLTIPTAHTNYHPVHRLECTVYILVLSHRSRVNVCLTHALVHDLTATHSIQHVV